MFDTKLEATSPLINVTYLILFDYGAIRHHEPILHVRSSMSNLIVPFLNHDYEGVYLKIPKYSDSQKIAVIILKFEQCGTPIE